MSEQTMIARWRYDKLRLAIAEALGQLAPLILHQETGHYLEKDEVYHMLVKANSCLAHGLHEGTQP